MRLDKYLKVARILKRRTVSKEMADSERVCVNGKIAKPSYDVKVGDEIEITFGQKRLLIRVLGCPEVVRKQDADNLYEIISESKVA